ncbi:hypothetical protein GHT06_012406 [Daphnia sinensis]|uniref:Protein kinase domain-containing protein n=1 Tax=Daphnia sinensis TaxID=1820382 RepID=A0AAD5PYV1_9CRUS|nr:hypothetical protein GHT06_012406 [Daphnia sinensis]
MEDYKVIGGIIYFTNDLLGEGSYGNVYRGIFNGESVAVKKILLKRSVKEEREVELQIKLNHKNVLAILNVAEDDDFRYIVLELCAGTLEEVINKTFKGPILPPDQVVLYEIADGLYYVHSQRLIHRDIKPENILISKSGQVKLSDFGLSKQISTRDTCSMSGIKGTLLWMAPELQGNNAANKATPKCDVFACGCVFFVFLTREKGGIHPFGDKNDHLKIQMNIRSGEPVNFDELERDDLVTDVIRKMTEEDPLIRMSSEEVKHWFRELVQPVLRLQRVLQAQQVQPSQRFQRVPQAQPSRRVEQAQRVQRAPQAPQAVRIEQAQHVQPPQQIQRAPQDLRIEQAQRVQRPQQIQRAPQDLRIEQAQRVQRPQQIQRAPQA